ncbi:natural resistance-associated macrophage protein-domain-containing protein [Syncephalis pseudoplumigaleata]|uniref:Natural resistance-associated macrophage protein-domain-containing protein n=1 Tax=Syncephalis pseudoplumigaleata TaxID=1712513 RepID=A0A4P9YXY5_9FUNG|nr:natural resistance-associated macrophage protein-domain-containing protein [Syncephalis pseudoplumigaleata]|eukprot:RKP24392.1 natural resistance-associated macrophage protein-domain-containing protein [Syncephalis pseudoplumigaleata]
MSSQNDPNHGASPAHHGHRTPNQLEMAAAASPPPNTVLHSGIFASSTFGSLSDTAPSSSPSRPDSHVAIVAAANVAASMSRSMSAISTRMSTDIVVIGNMAQPGSSFTPEQGLCLGYSTPASPAFSITFHTPVLTSPTCNVIHTPALSGASFQPASTFGYTLLPVLLVASISACLFQSMALRLGLVSGRDLAEMCRREFPAQLYWPIYIINELGVRALQLTQIISGAIALELLTGMPLSFGVCITSVAAFVLLLLYQSPRHRWSSHVAGGSLAILLVFAIGLCLSTMLWRTHSSIGEIMMAALPDGSLVQTRQGRLLIVMALIGTTAMPHNLFLHSHLAARQQSPERDPSTANQHRTNLVGIVPHESPCHDTGKRHTSPEAMEPPSTSEKQPGSIRPLIRRAIMHSTLALLLVFVCNILMLVLGGITFRGQHADEGRQAPLVRSMENANFYHVHRSMHVQFGASVAAVFAAILLAVALYGTLTTIMAGQVIMAGFGRWRCSPALRNLLTLLPVLLVAAATGRDGTTRLLLICHIILGVQLPFSILPLVWLTGKARVMRTTPTATRHSRSTKHLSPAVIVTSPEMTYRPCPSDAPSLPQFHKSVVDGSGHFYGRQSVALPHKVIFDQEEEMLRLQLEDSELNVTNTTATESAARQSSQIMQSYDMSANCHDDEPANALPLVM